MVDANGRQPADDESSGGADIVMESIAQVCAVCSASNWGFERNRDLSTVSRYCPVSQIFAGWAAN